MTYTAKARLYNSEKIWEVVIVSKMTIEKCIENIGYFCKHDYNILSISIEADTDNV